MPVAERPLSPEELYAADSAFFCGTAVEIVGIESINNQSFPVAWETTLGYQLQQAFRKKVREQETVKPNETILI
jgi:branched-chain amino acid aminotransferase